MEPRDAPSPLPSRRTPATAGRPSWESLHPWQMAACIATLSLLVRLAASLEVGAFVDEAYIWYLSRAPLGTLLEAARPDLNTPFFTLLVHLFPGTHPTTWVLRLPSAAGGALACGASYLLGARLLSPRVALGASLLASITYASVLNDAQIRPYGVVAGLVTGLLLLVGAEEAAPSRQVRSRLRSLHAVLAFLLALQHYLGAVMVAALLVADGWRREQRWVVATSLPGLMAAGAWLAWSWNGPVHSTMSNRLAQGSTSLSWDWLQTPGYLLGWQVPLQLVPLGNTTAGPGALLTVTGWAVDLACWSLVLRGWARLRHHQAHLARRLGALLASTLAVLTVGAALGIQPYQHRYCASLASLWILLGVAGLLGVQPPGSSRDAALRSAPTWGYRFIYWSTAVLQGCLLLGLLSTSYFWNQDWPAVSRFIRERERPGDVVAVHVPYSLLGLGYALDPDALRVDFSRPGQLAFEASSTYRGCELLTLTPSSLTPALEAQLRGRRIFLVLNQETAAAGGSVRSWFAERYGVLDALELPSLHTWGRTSVYLLVVPRPAPP